jgi:hypothetical protein
MRKQTPILRFASTGYLKSAYAFPPLTGTLFTNAASHCDAEADTRSALQGNPAAPGAGGADASPATMTATSTAFTPLHRR